MGKRRVNHSQNAKSHDTASGNGEIGHEMNTCKTHGKPRMNHGRRTGKHSSSGEMKHEEKKCPFSERTEYPYPGQ
ncbi:hypothetical protein Tco_1362351 [Tanacetum coccineum]